MSVYDFASEIQDDILKLMVRDSIFSNASYYWVKSEYFDGIGRQWLAKFILSFYERFSVPPTISQVATEAVQQLKLGRLDGAVAKELSKLIINFMKK